MSRMQLALNVSNLDEAVDFYSTFFKVPPAKRRPGYANFAIDEPPLKLVLIENAINPGTINHLGVEVFRSGEVTDAITYLTDAGFTTDVEELTTCCYALQNKVWVDGPDGARWEVYTVLDDAVGGDDLGDDQRCCTTATTEQAPGVVSAAGCC